MKRTVLITGASRGIGAGIARLFAENGYNVVLNYNKSEKEAFELAKELEPIADVLPIKCDISKEQAVVDMVNQALRRFGKIDVLINNAGFSIDKLFSEKTPEDFRKTFDTNVIGTFMVSKLVGEIMAGNRWGRIINISSTNGINTYFPMCADYDAAKAAVNSLTHNLAVQFAPFVTVNAIAPGFIGTESELSGMDEEFIDYEKEKIMVRRIGTVEDVANLALFLASENAGFINNEIIRIDGGTYGAC